jgi:hypothetical protein
MRAWAIFSGEPYYLQARDKLQDLEMMVIVGAMAAAQQRHAAAGAARRR